MNEKAKFLETNDDQKERIQEVRNSFSKVYEKLKNYVSQVEKLL